jgi:hypothetical protein
LAKGTSAVAAAFEKFESSAALAERRYAEDLSVEDYVRDMGGALAELLGEVGAEEVLHYILELAQEEPGYRACMLASLMNGQKFEGKRSFFRQFCENRPDKVSALIECISKLGGDRSHGASRGMKDALEALTFEQLKETDGLRECEYNLYDCINLVYADSDAIEQYRLAHPRVYRSTPTPPLRQDAGAQAFLCKPVR